MSKLEKAKLRLAGAPKDYTYSEAKSLLGKLGYVESNKGRTSGSRVRFFRPEDKAIINLHKPHPGDIMSPGAIEELRDYLQERGELL